LPRPSGEGVRLERIISVESRITNSQEAMNLFLKSPIIGVGFDTLRYVREKTEIVAGSTQVSHSGAGFHNSYFFILATTGIAGLLSYFWIWRKLFESTHEKEILLITLTAVAVHSFFDNSLFYPWVMMWLWIVTGVRVGRSPSFRL
ncbi:MAG: O-antigen ligase family protein, partial [Patescibacteria group bacterium]